MKTMYRARYIEVTIQAMEVTRESAASVWYNVRGREMKEAKSSGSHGWYETFEDAKTAMLGKENYEILRCTSEVERLKRELASRQERIARIEAL